MILHIRNYKIQQISHQGRILSADELRSPEFRDKRYWDRYNTVETFLSTKVEERKGKGYGNWHTSVHYPHRYMFHHINPLWQGEMDLDLDTDFPEMLRLEKERKQQKYSFKKTEFTPQF